MKRAGITRRQAVQLATPAAAIRVGGVRRKRRKRHLQQTMARQPRGMRRTTPHRLLLQMPQVLQVVVVAAVQRDGRGLLQLHPVAEEDGCTFPRDVTGGKLFLARRSQTEER